MKKMFALLAVLVYCTLLFSQSTAGFQEYFVPGPENDLYYIWEYVYSGTGMNDDFRAVISITATSDNTEIIYDHWEDGLTSGSVTDDSSETIILNSGDYYAFDDTFIDIPVSGQNYDGGDRIYVTGGPVFVVRAAIAHDYMAVCWELLPVQAWRGGSGGVDFVMPFGTDLYYLGGTNTNEVFHDFQRVAVVIQSAADGNVINVVCPNDSTTFQGTLSRGETKYLTSIQHGATVTCTSEAQVHMVIGSNYGYDIRGLSGIPTFNGYGNNYWAPIESSADTDMFIFNHNGSPITVYYEDAIESDSFIVPANGSVSYEDNTGHFIHSGAHLYTSLESTGNEFCTVLSADTDSGRWDWSAVLVQQSILGTDYRIGWAPGGSTKANGQPGDPEQIDNCIFAIATENGTDIFVDFDGNGTIDQSFNGSNSLNKLDVELIADQSDYDTSGARIWTNDKKIALIYGEIAGSNPFHTGDTPAGSPAMDLGYTILPMPETWIDPVIEITAADDQGSTVIYAAGDNVEFTITLNAHGYDLTNVDLSSVLDVGWEYVPNSTNITHNIASGTNWISQAEPSDPYSTNLLWDISRDVLANDSMVLTFQAYPTITSEDGENEIVTETVGTYSSHEFGAYDSEFVTLGDGAGGEPSGFGDEPVSVCLGEFLISIDTGVPVLAWTTQSESNNLGWNIYRNLEDNFANATQINSQLIEGAGSSSIPTEYTFADNGELESGSVYWYYLEDVDYGGSTSIIASGYILITEDIQIYDNEITGIYPNPFNPSTVISFSLENTTKITLSVYNSRGQKVVELLNSTLEAGKYTEEWNGTNLKGNRVSSGVYFVNMSFKGRSITKKMLLIK